MNDDDLYRDWICRVCNCTNSDRYEDTAGPTCFNCDEEYSWDELLSEEEMGRLNKLLARKETQMKCKNCNNEVSRHTILQICHECYLARKRKYQKQYRALNTTKAIPQWQSRGVRSAEWMVCCRTDCARKFRRQPYQHEKYTMCPQHKILANGYSGAVKWLGRT